MSTVIGTGFALTALGTLLAFAPTTHTIPWIVVIVFVVGAAATLALAAATLWVFLSDDRAAESAGPRRGGPAPTAVDALEAAIDGQRRLLDDVRHELKTPITIVRGHLELMDPADPRDAVATRDLGIAELDRMTRLIGDIDLLATVESDTFTMGDVSLPELIDDVFERVSVIPAHRWSVEQRATGVIRGDRDRLVQAWLQLAENAAKYTPESTPIEIGCAVHPSGVQMWVRDHGPGIPPAMRHRVFGRFHRGTGRRSVGGSGLGLAIVDAIAKAHDGHCRVADTPGGGATFTLELPLGTRATLPPPLRAGDVVMQREESG